MASRHDHIPYDFRHGEFLATAWGGSWRPLDMTDLSGWKVVPRWHDRSSRALEPGEVPPGCELVAGGILLDGTDQGVTIATGDVRWRDIELSLLMSPLAGESPEVYFRVDDAAPGLPTYFFSMHPKDHTVTVMREAYGWVTPLSAVHYQIEYGQEYPVTIMSRGQSITTYIDGTLVNQVTDSHCLRGGVALSANESKCLFRDIKYRVRKYLPTLPAGVAEQWSDEDRIPLEHLVERACRYSLEGE